MSDRIKWISVIFKFAFAVIILLGILDRAGLFSGDPQLQTLVSFTTISNAFIMALALVMAVRTLFSAGQTGPALAGVRYVGVVMILITGLVYHFVLLPQKLAENPGYQVFTYGNIVAHYLAPAGMLADWLLFDEKGRVSWWAPLICAALPLAYFVAASVYGYFGPNVPGGESPYVYFFMDVSQLGMAGVAGWVAVILAGILCLAYLILALDRLLVKRGKKLNI